MPAGGLISVCYNDWFPIPGVTLSGLDWDDGPRGLLDSVAPKTGAYATALPTDPNPYATAAGKKVTSYFDDYYNRIHFTPGRYDFGAVTSELSTNVVVWNAYVYQTVELLSTDIDGATGVTVDPGAPWTFEPLAAHTFSMAIGASGLAVVDHAMLWQFDIPFTYEFGVTGTRAKEWPLSPNWEQSYKIAYSFKTEILQSRSGKEQRIALRTSPRKDVSYQSLALGNAEFNRVKELLWAWQDKGFVLPELTRFVTSTLELLPGGSTMQVDDDALWLVPDSLVLLEYNGDTAVLVVESAAAGSVTFKAATAATWPVGTRVYAALSGFIGSDMQAIRVTNAVSRLEMRFAVSPLSEPWIAPPVAPATFNGRELFLKRPNWVQEVSATAQHAVDEIDYDRGGIYRYSPFEFGIETRRALYLGRDAAEAQLMLDLYMRMRGRQGEFYMPTWEYDIVPKEAVSPASAGLRVSGPGLVEGYAESSVHKAIFVMKQDGTLLFRKVLSVSLVTDGGGTDSLITVDSVWGTTFDASNIVMCGWMPVWRLASDDLVIEWVTSTVAQVQLTMQTLEDLPV